MARIESKQSKCVECKLDCEFKGKDSYPRVEDLVKVPNECDYKKEIQKTATLMLDNLRKHIATLNPALMAAQQMRSMISQQQIKAIMEMNLYYQQQMKAIAESIARFSEIARSAEMLSAIESYRNFQPYLESARSVARLMSMSTPIYFPSKEFLVLEKPIKVPKKSVAMKFIERLDACPKGKEGWSEYQDLCKEILVHLFVPPLMEPVEQSRTETGLHIRDLIFDIPYSINGFWAYVRDKFDASALIVECKNFSSPIEGNQIVISSKYLGKNKLGRFGIVFSRVDPAESAVKEAKGLWARHDELILCLTDAHLIRMLDLKERNVKPEIVIDDAIHQFLRVLE